MTPNDLSRLAIIASARTEGDVRPEDVTALRVEIPGAGWTERETGLPPPDAMRLNGWGYSCRWWDDEEVERMQPPDEGSFVRGMVIALPIALWLWALLIWGIAIWAGWRPFARWT